MKNSTQTAFIIISNQEQLFAPPAKLEINLGNAGLTFSGTKSQPVTYNQQRVSQQVKQQL